MSLLHRLGSVHSVENDTLNQNQSTMDSFDKDQAKGLKLILQTR